MRIKTKVLLMTVMSLSIVCCASAAMRNLLSEFGAAINTRDSQKAQAIIKEGVDANDAAREIVNKNPSGKDDEDFFVPLLKALAKKGSFKDIPLYVGSEQTGYDHGNITLGIPIISNKILAALLDGGADPDKPRRMMDRQTRATFDSHTTMLFETLDALGNQAVITKDDKLLERVKILAEHKANLKNVGVVVGGLGKK